MSNEIQAHTEYTVKSLKKNYLKNGNDNIGSERNR